MIVCRQCGQQAREGVDFCESCGAYLEWEGERVDAPAPPPRPRAERPDGGLADGGLSGGGSPDPGPAWTAGPPPPVSVPPPPLPQPPVPVSPPPPPPVSVPPPPPPQPPVSTPPDAVPARIGAPPPPPGGARTAPATVMCLECGANNAGDRRFCRRCGSSLELVALAGPSPATGGPAAPATVPDPGVGLDGPVPPAGPPATARPPAPPVPDAPAVVARAPAVPASRGLQPAEAPPRPPATRPASTSPDVAPGGPICAQCGTANPPGRRFCRRCGASVAAEVPAFAEGDMPQAHRRGLWARIVAKMRREDPDEGYSASDSARAAYRASLDVRYRVFRVLAVVGGLALVAGSLGFAGYNPVSGARGLWTKAFPRDKRIDELAGNADPPQAVDVNFAPGAAVDGDPSTAWAANWQQAKGDKPAQGCTDQPTTGGADAALILTMPQPAKLSKLSIQPGLPPGDPERAAQWQPTRIELRFDDGSCKVVDLADQAGFQDRRIQSPLTRHVRMAVLGASAPTDAAASKDKVTIGEVRLYRPR